MFFFWFWWEIQRSGCLAQETTSFIVYIELKYVPIEQEYTFYKDNLQVKRHTLNTLL